jgi:hypothetical protein
MVASLLDHDDRLAQLTQSFQRVWITVRLPGHEELFNLVGHCTRANGNNDQVLVTFKEELSPPSIKPWYIKRAVGENIELILCMWEVVVDMQAQFVSLEGRLRIEVGGGTTDNQAGGWVTTEEEVIAQRIRVLHLQDSAAYLQPRVSSLVEGAMEVEIRFPSLT